MYPLSYYKQFIDEALWTNDGFYGYLLELAVKDFFGLPLIVSEAGKTDCWRVPIDGHDRVLEVKQNGGDFRTAGKGNSYIAYAVYIDINQDLAHQFGYMMQMQTFRDIGNGPLHHVRAEKKDHKGEIKMSLQTLYVYKKKDFLGKKAFKLADAWEDAGAVSFKDFFRK